MKNIHILPTDKPSRLVLGNNGNFVFGMMQTATQSNNNDFTNQTIYITSDEEIKEGDYFMNETNTIEVGIGNYDYKILSPECKKIILTTDQDLIKDGVQDIDDEFLEWFVKNPSCERVELKKGFADGTAWGYNFLDYKIIIPQEIQTKLENNKIASEILLKYEDLNEYHLHDVDRKWIIEAMQEYVDRVSVNNTEIPDRVVDGDKEMNRLKVVKIADDAIYFENNIKLYSYHDGECCEWHELNLNDLTIEEFRGLEFNLTSDSFFKRIPDYGIELIPIYGHSVKIAGHGYNNGYYSDQLDLIIEQDGKEVKRFDITECQIIRD